jgi:hypothetical protein
MARLRSRFLPRFVLAAFLVTNSALAADTPAQTLIAEIATRSEMQRNLEELCKVT